MRGAEAEYADLVRVSDTFQLALAADREANVGHFRTSRDDAE